MKDELTAIIVEAQMEIEQAKHTMLYANAKIEVAEKLLAKFDKAETPEEPVMPFEQTQALDESY